MIFYLLTYNTRCIIPFQFVHRAIAAMLGALASLACLSIRNKVLIINNYHDGNEHNHDHYSDHSHEHDSRF